MWNLKREGKCNENTRKVQGKYKKNIFMIMSMYNVYIYRYDKIDNLHYENKFTITFRPLILVLGFSSWLFLWHISKLVNISEFLTLQRLKTLISYYLIETKLQQFSRFLLIVRQRLKLAINYLYSVLQNRVNLFIKLGRKDVLARNSISPSFTRSRWMT